MTKKPTAKQLKARAKFKYIMQHGGFKKRKSSVSPRIKNIRASAKRIKKSIKKMDKIISKSDIARQIEKALNDNTVKEIIIRK